MQTDPQGHKADQSLPGDLDGGKDVIRKVWGNFCNKTNVIFICGGVLWEYTSTNNHQIVLFKYVQFLLYLQKVVNKKIEAPYNLSKGILEPHLSLRKSTG